jgi:hypothetical protein
MFQPATYRRQLDEGPDRFSEGRRRWWIVLGGDQSDDARRVIRNFEDEHANGVTRRMLARNVDYLGRDLLADVAAPPRGRWRAVNVATLPAEDADGRSDCAGRP